MNGRIGTSPNMLTNTRTRETVKVLEKMTDALKHPKGVFYPKWKFSHHLTHPRVIPKPYAVFPRRTQKEIWGQFSQNHNCQGLTKTKKTQQMQHKICLHDSFRCSLMVPKSRFSIRGSTNALHGTTCMVLLWFLIYLSWFWHPLLLYGKDLCEDSLEILLLCSAVEQTCGTTWRVHK